MIKKNINIIDLDKTLIPYDSYRLLVKQELNKFNLFIVWVTLLRVIRLISMLNYKKKVVQYLQKKYNIEYFKEYTDKLFNDINNSVLSLVTKETDSNTINILLSASPNIFVKYLIIKLKWEGSGSYFDDNGNFIHLYGKEKISWLQNNYSCKIYNYNFAISDSISDDELLSLFSKNVKWEV